MEGGKGGGWTIRHVHKYPVVMSRSYYSLQRGNQRKETLNGGLTDELSAAQIFIAPAKWSISMHGSRPECCLGLTTCEPS